MPAKMYRTAPFVRLGRIIETILSDRPAIFEELVRGARRDNPWFTAESVRLALQAISRNMLREDKLRGWLEGYPLPDGFTAKNVGIVMAGNIPLVGFFDQLCAAVCGHRVYVKTSSKDSSLMNRAIRTLLALDRSMEIISLEADSPLDAVIATGSDNTNRYFRSRYGNIPHLLRGSRISVAVLTGDESPAQLQGLTADVFDYFGMGCRSVSRFFVPEGYDTGILTAALGRRNVSHPKYRQAYAYHKALLQMRKVPFTDGGFFTLRESAELSEALPDLVFSRYRSPEEVREWTSVHDRQLQCVVGEAVDHPRRVDFGEAQHPELRDYPDGMDVMAFLTSL